MEIHEARALTKEELTNKKRDSRQELFNLEQQKKMGQLEKPSRFNEVRKDIARYETALSEQRLGLKITSHKSGKKTKKA